MPKKNDYTLSVEELEGVEKSQKSGSSPQERVRATGLRMLHLGKKPAEVAKLLNVSLATVYTWHQRRVERGVSELEPTTS